LLSIHGRVDPLAEVDLSPPKHADVKVVYNQINKEVTNDENEEKQTKLLKIDLNKSVKDFKVQLRSVFEFFPFFEIRFHSVIHFSSMFGVSPSQMRVYYVDHEMSEILGPEELRFNQKKLYTYNIQDGDEFLIDHK